MPPPRRSITGRIGLLTLVLAASLSSADDASPSEAAARAALEKLAARHATMTTMRGSFIQEIHTPLAKKPLVSRGEMFFRREPACAVFELLEPRRSTIRFDEKSYRIYRPAEERAETFVFKSDDLAGSFVRVFAPRAQEREKVFRVADCREITLTVPKPSATSEPEDPSDGVVDGSGKGAPPTSIGESAPIAALQITLHPLRKDLENHFKELQLVVSPDDGALHRVAYTNAQGDTIVITLQGLELDPKLDPKRFDETLPPGTRTKVHVL
ncbi:MAG: outer membrane lipoprotein carrier protein LolA [Planctomycetes bacterium]|nr:outer membrane lipoprotein carrier protein LolA [Planctomycetota bacterium]